VLERGEVQMPKKIAYGGVLRVAEKRKRIEVRTIAAYFLVRETSLAIGIF